MINVHKTDPTTADLPCRDVQLLNIISQNQGKTILELEKISGIPIASLYRNIEKLQNTELVFCTHEGYRPNKPGRRKTFYFSRYKVEVKKLPKRCRCDYDCFCGKYR